MASTTNTRSLDTTNGEGYEQLLRHGQHILPPAARRGGSPDSSYTRDNSLAPIPPPRLAPPQAGEPPIVWYPYEGPRLPSPREWGFPFDPFDPFGEGLANPLAPLLAQLLDPNSGPLPVPVQQGVPGPTCFQRGPPSLHGRDHSYPWALRPTRHFSPPPGWYDEDTGIGLRSQQDAGHDHHPQPRYDSDAREGFDQHPEHDRTRAPQPAREVFQSRPLHDSGVQAGLNRHGEHNHLPQTRCDSNARTGVVRPVEHSGMIPAAPALQVCVIHSNVAPWKISAGQHVPRSAPVPVSPHATLRELLGAVALPKSRWSRVYQVRRELGGRMILGMHGPEIGPPLEIYVKGVEITGDARWLETRLEDVFGRPGGETGEVWLWEQQVPS